MKKETKIILMIVGIIVIIGVIAATFIFINKNNSDDAANPEVIRAQLEDIQTKFSSLSNEIVSDDKKTLKDGYSKEQQAVFDAILAKVGELDKFTESGKNELSEEKYYEELSKKTTEIQDLITALDNDIHTNKVDFKTVYTELKGMLENFVKEAVTEDNKTLKDKFKEYQADFDKVLQDIMALASEIDEKNVNQEYLDKMTEKGQAILAKLKELGEKTGIKLK